MKLVYIAGPYTGKNSWETHVIGKLVMERAPGWFPLLPESNHNEDYDLAREYFNQADVERMIRCDAVLLIPEWRNCPESISIRDEAVKRLIPVYGDIIDLPVERGGIKS